MTRDGQKKKKIFEWRGNKSTFKKETNRNMKTIDMKIVNNTENMDITIKGQRVEEERRIQNRVKQEIKKEGLKKWKASMEKKKSLRWYKNKEKTKKMKKYIMGLGNPHFYSRLGRIHLKSMKRKRNGEGQGSNF